MTKVGWEFVSWTGRPGVCNVAPCSRHVNAGHVRVDRSDPYRADFVVICVDCWGLIMAGVDPDPGAAVPEWEQANRDERLREALADG